MASADQTTAAADGGGGPNVLARKISASATTSAHATIEPARARARVAPKYTATPPANTANSTASDAGSEFHSPRPTRVDPRNGVSGISGRCINTSRNQWLTTSSAIVRPAEIRARRSVTYAAPKTAPHTTSITRLCEYG